MNDLFNQLSFESGESFSVLNYCINIILCSALLFILSLIFVKYGRSLSNRNQLSKVLIVVGVTTFIIISIVKSSLALSLGLVGALSIIRFRTAIKEPEELGYFFIAISIGLGFGANQLLPTVIGALVLFVIIYLSSFKKTKNTTSQNLLINLKNADMSSRVEIQSKITDIITNNSSRTELIRLNIDTHSLDFNFLVVLKNYEYVNTITNDLTRLDENMSITFIDSQNMTI
ncbi:DUF4956 domain-containing protein [Pseudozobellia sp. WGM2]|uniref:DUF4956 domain-containing protein n=1 Tax=Pseudozobellia sp. WGM2 TaxID=2787625 RepID=UPI001AE081EB|nr:DUF4956 domain-containing protein [Pseudozobellia sp. WGM2]